MTRVIEGLYTGAGILSYIKTAAKGKKQETEGIVIMKKENILRVKPVMKTFSENWYT